MRRAWPLIAAVLLAQVQTPSGLKPLPPPQQPPAVTQPGAPPPKPESFGDKVTRCLHYGATQGVQPGDLGQYTRECAQQ